MSTAVAHHDADSTDIFGFWLYLMTDCVIFASLFATFIVLNKPGAYGPALAEFIDLKYVLIETFALLASNFCFGLAALSLNKQNVTHSIFWLVLTFLFGAVFVGMELHEFMALAEEGYHWTTSGAASSFFTLVGTHGLHVSVGLLWIVIMIMQLSMFKLDPAIKRRMVYLGLFWNFLDIVWIFLFSVVYLMGVL